MLKYILVLGVFAVGCASTNTDKSSTANNVVQISRYITINTCYTGQGKCIGRTVKNIEEANIKLDMQQGTARDIYKLEDEGIVFQSDIRITKKADQDEYLVYIMIHSGDRLNREARIKTFKIKDLSKMPITRVLDKPIKFKGGTLQAELVVGPRMAIHIANHRSQPNILLTCQGQDSGWLSEKKEALKNHELIKYASSVFGPATGCSGKVISHFENRKFGEMTFDFNRKAFFKSEAFPPEVSMLTLTVENGFSNEKEAILKIQEVAKNAGLKIKMNKPEVKKSGAVETKTYWDPSEGVNGRLFLVYKNSKLTSIGYGMAL